MDRKVLKCEDDNKLGGIMMDYINQNKLDGVKRWVKSNELKFNRGKFEIQKETS